MKQKLAHFIDDKGVNHAPIHIDPITGILYYLKRHTGRVIKFSTKCKADQLVRAKRLINEELAVRLGTKKKVRTQSLIKDELPLWYNLKKTEGLAEDTLKNIRNAIKQIDGFWGDRFPVEMLSADVKSEWYAWFQTEYSGQQMENAIKYIRNFCGYLNQKLVNDVPVLPARPSFQDPNRKAVRRARKERKKRIFTAEEFKKVYDSGNDQEKLIALIMYTMATRITETLELKFGEQIFLDEEMPTYRWSDGQNKADHDGMHALHEVLIGPLRELRRVRAGEGTWLLFPQLRDNQAPLKEQQIDWKAWEKRAEVGWHWTSHTFRHTCLSNLFNDERNPQALILKLYRVSLAVALETYVKPTESGIQKMRSAIRVNL